MDYAPITGIANLQVILSFTRAHRPMVAHVVYTDPAWSDIPYPGVSVVLVSIDVVAETAVIESANGDRRTVPVATLHARGEL